MLAARSIRQSSRFHRGLSTIGNDIFPHAESSSAPSRRRQYASSAEATVVSDQTGEISSASPLEGTYQSRSKRNIKSNPKAKQAFLRARKLAEAIRSEKEGNSAQISRIKTSTNVEKAQNGDSNFWSDLLNKPTTIDTSSQQTVNTNSSPTLDDLLSKKPDREPPDPWHPKYPQLYRKVYESLDSAFVHRQLKSFSTQLGIYHNAKASKGGMIKKIMKSWKWVEPRNKPKDPDPFVFDLPPPELFLFVRQEELIQSLMDGYERLNMSILPFSEVPQPSSIMLTPNEGDPNRKVLVASGKLEPLMRLSQIISDQKQTLQNVTISSGEINQLKASDGLLRMVSNASGAYVESLPENKYRITAKSSEDIESAKQLLGIASLHSEILPSYRSLDVLLPTPRNFQTQPLRLSLYPFTPSLTESFPWTILPSIASKTLFRLKKVTEWNSKPAIREIDQKNEKIHIAPYLKEAERRKGETEFQNLIMDLTAKKGKKRLKLQFGNLLFPIQPKDGRLGTFDNPLPGLWPIETLKNWLIPSHAGNSMLIQSISLTPSMIQFPLIEGQSKELRRIRYRSIPSSPTPADSPSSESRFVEFTYTKERTREEKWQDQYDAALNKLEKAILEEEQTIGQEQSITPDEQIIQGSAEEVESHSSTSLFSKQTSAINEGSPEVSEALTSVDEVESISSTTPETFEAVFGVIKESDLLIPDRPNDVRITSTSTVTLPENKIPEAISAIFEAEKEGKLSSSLLPPSKVNIKDEEYTLEYDERVEMIEEAKDIEIAGNTLTLFRRSMRVIEQGMEGKSKPLVYSELECGSTSYGTLPIEFYRELAFMTRDVGPDAGALKRGNILSAFGGSAGWNGMTGY
uniref:Uncharacterized protein n=1 Tax=Kwoniella pini CBS 10737 TaxID=1296096 RepID=A0A1B9I9I4_9TREE|nr:uncharacterized protein I206_01490 [Kwoniella pini CBS 10737]OCF52205.1 hypothetical protein I206_01490 [Kwoniella pini CBS 10737]